MLIFIIFLLDSYLLLMHIIFFFINFFVKKQVKEFLPEHILSKLIFFLSLHIILLPNIINFIIHIYIAYFIFMSFLFIYVMDFYFLFLYNISIKSNYKYFVNILDFQSSSQPKMLYSFNFLVHRYVALGSRFLFSSQVFHAILVSYSCDFHFCNLLLY